MNGNGGYMQPGYGLVQPPAQGIAGIPGIGQIARALGQIMPGQQTWLGERAGGQGVGMLPWPLGGLFQAGAALMPGYQPWLGEPAAPGSARPPPGAVYMWNTNPEAPQYGVWFYRLYDGKIAVQNKMGVWKTYWLSLARFPITRLL